MIVDDEIIVQVGQIQMRLQVTYCLDQIQFNLKIKRYSSTFHFLTNTSFTVLDAFEVFITSSI